MPPQRDRHGRFVKGDAAPPARAETADEYLARVEQELGAADTPADDLRPLVLAGMLLAVIVAALVLVAVVVAVAR